MNQISRINLQRFSFESLAVALKDLVYDLYLITLRAFFYRYS